MATEYIDKPNPELSASQLAEYIGAGHSRQDGILRQARFVAKENAAPRIWYQQARTAISKFIASGWRDYSHLEEAKAKFQAIVDGTSVHKRPVTDFVINNAKLSIDAIEAFISSLNQIRLGGFNCSLPSGMPDRLSIEGVAVSIRPDVILTGADRSGAPTVGGIVMYFGKDGEKESRQDDRQEQGRVLATLVQRYAAERLASRGVADRKLCLALDVFAKKLHPVPASNTRRSSNITIGCRHVVVQWPHVEAPDWWPR